MRIVLSPQHLFLLLVGPYCAASQWTQVGSDIDGENPQDYAGGTQKALAMNGLGSTVAVGSAGYDGASDGAGHVRVFDLLDGDWRQRGSDIQGETAADGSGTSVVMSDDGTVVGIGEPYSEAGYTDQFDRFFGQVRIFEWKEGEEMWIQRGQAIKGIDACDFASEAGGLAMDASGSTVIIGASSHDINGLDGRFQGHARVFDWDGTDWNQRGSDMIGEAPGDNFGHAVALNSSGNTVAVGAIFNDVDSEDGGLGCNICRGSVRIFDWNTDIMKWLQRGNDVDGEQDFDLSGSSVALNGVGDVVVIGSPQSFAPNGRRGAVTVYEWNGSDWQKRGDKIEGEADGDRSGSAVDMSVSGDMIAIGSYLNQGSSDLEGHVRVYDWDGNNWLKRGDDIDGENAYDYSGYALAVSADGNTLASGARFNDDAGYDAGHARVFGWQGGKETCDDDPSWTYNGNNNKDCGWVLLKKNKRCDLEDENGMKANDACALACKNTSICEIPDCLRNSQWQPKDGSFNNCKSIRFMTTKRQKVKACTEIGSDELTFGYEACRQCTICKK